MVSLQFEKREGGKLVQKKDRKRQGVQNKGGTMHIE
jgi:hypothetical protein